MNDHLSDRCRRGGSSADGTPEIPVSLWPCFDCIESLVPVVFKCSSQSQAVVKRYGTEDPKRAIDYPPAKWYVANRSANQGQRNNEHASNETSLQNPNVP